MADTTTAQRAATLTRNKLQRPAQALPQQSRFPEATDQRGHRQSTSPSYADRALRLSKSLATGGRDRKTSIDKQLIGEAAARGGQALGATVGSYVPILGTAIGAAIGKRMGRILGEHWPIVAAYMAINIIITSSLFIGFFLVIFYYLSKLSPAYRVYEFFT